MSSPTQDEFERLLKQYLDEQDNNRRLRKTVDYQTTRLRIMGKALKSIADQALEAKNEKS